MTTPRWLLPVALAAAALFAWRLPALWPLVPLGGAVEPAGQIAAARAFLRAEGVDVSAHRAAASVAVDGLVLDHLDSLVGRETTLALVARTWVVGGAVQFKRAGDPDAVVAWVHPSGRVARWLRERQDDAAAAAVDSARAAQLAESALGRVALDATAPPWRVVGAAVRERPARVDRTFTYERVLVEAPALRERAIVTVSGDAVSAVVRNIVVPDDARRARLAAQAPMQTLSSVGFLTLACGIVAAFGLLLHALRDGRARIGAPAVVAGLVFAGVVATFFLDPSWLLGQWQPLWPWATAPLVGLERIGLLNAWLALVLYVVVAAGDAEDRRVGADRGHALWALLRGRVTEPGVARAAWRGWLVGLCCGGVMAATVWGIDAATGAPTALQPRGFFVKVLDAQWPSLTALLFFTCVALAEELGYRFFIGTWLERLTGRRWVAIWLPALVYGLTHTALDFLPPAGPYWARPLVLTLVGAVWGWAFFRFDALTVVLSHLSADLFIFNWPRLASGAPAIVAAAAVTMTVPLLLAVPAALRRRPPGRPAAAAPA